MSRFESWRRDTPIQTVPTVQDQAAEKSARDLSRALWAIYAARQSAIEMPAAVVPATVHFVYGEG